MKNIKQKQKNHTLRGRFEAYKQNRERNPKTD